MKIDVEVVKNILLNSDKRCYLSGKTPAAILSEVSIRESRFELIAGKPMLVVQFTKTFDEKFYVAWWINFTVYLDAHSKVFRKIVLFEKHKLKNQTLYYNEICSH